MQEYRGIGYHINPRTQEIMPTTHSAGTKRLWTSYDDLKAFKRDVDEGWANKKHIDLINERKEISYKIDSLHRQGIRSGFDYEKLQELYRQIGGELIYRKHGGKGWHGERQRHKDVAERAQAKHARNTPMTRTQREIRLRLIHEHQHHDPTTGFIEWKPNTPQHIKDLEKDIAREQTQEGYFIMMEDRMGNITLSHSGSKRVAFFQAEADKEFISDLLKKGEKEDLENGYNVEIKDSEPRASALSELWEASGGG